jgi:hypothetical protein
LAEAAATRLCFRSVVTRYLPFAGITFLEYWFSHGLGEFHVCFAVAGLMPLVGVVGVVGHLGSSVLTEGAAKPQPVDGVNCVPDVL